MPFFSFTKKSTRAQVAEKKPITIGPFVERCPPGDLANRVHLIPLEQAQMSKKIKLRTVIPYPDSPEMVAEVGLWEADVAHAGRHPSSVQRQEKRSVSGSSTATTSSTSSTDSYSDSDCSLLPEVFDYYVCHKPLPPSRTEDALIAGVDQSCLFDELEELCNPVRQSALFDELDALCSKAPAAVVSPVKVKTSKRTRRGAIVRVEDTLISLDAAYLRSDIRHRPELFEMEC
ncbi:hypothetical protein BC835DRAFT_1304822 [Cytidiella melzeri]|nr:hypothetical protein BC835DRAFT_1304822 [Cytidiella melzeri]